jgi:hypothetical protein
MNTTVSSTTGLDAILNKWVKKPDDSVTPLHRVHNIVYGKGGTGKSTLLSGMPETYIIDLEGKMMALKPQFCSGPIRDYAKLRELVRDLISIAADPKRPFHAIAIDSVDCLRQLAIDHHAAGVDRGGRGVLSPAAFQLPDWGFVKNYELAVLHELHRVYPCTLVYHIQNRYEEIGSGANRTGAIAERMYVKLDNHAEFLENFACNRFLLEATLRPGDKEALSRQIVCRTAPAVGSVVTFQPSSYVSMPPEIILDPANPWASLNDAYLTAAATKGKA